MSTYIKTVVFTLILFMSLNAKAEVISCVGQATNGDALHVLYDSDSSSINLHNKVHKIKSGSVSDQGATSESFTNVHNVNVYVVLILNDKTKQLKIYDAKSNKVKGTFNLACHNV